jgi:hypothetical protein
VFACAAGPETVEAIGETGSVVINPR